MQPTTSFAVALPLLLMPITAAGRDADFQVWSTLSAAVPLSDTGRANLDLSHRLRSEAAGGDQVQLRGSVSFPVAPGVELGGGLTFSDNRRGNELRPSQQISLTFGMLTLRTQFEERVFSDHPRTGLRLRERMQVKFPVDTRLQASASTELFYVFRATMPGGPTGFDQLRAAIAAQHRIGRQVDLGLGYTMILGLGGPSPRRISHVPQLTLYLRP